MKIPTTCTQCLAETAIPNFLSFAIVDIPECGWIETTCDRGHRAAVIIQESKFEILSAMGVNAIANGFYRDAVLSLTTSLERLYEFFIEAVCRKQGISSEAFAAIWKSMASQSERQLGAFITTFLLATGGTPKLLPKKQVEFRNSVVHKGRFPTREEAIQFGEAIFDCALSVLTVLRTDIYAGIMRTLTFERMDNRSRQARDGGLWTSVISIPTPLGIANTDLPKNFGTIVASYVHPPDGRSVEGFHELGAKIAALVKDQAGQP